MKTHPLSRRTFLTLVAGATTTAALAACVAQTPAPAEEGAGAPATEAVTIDIWEQQVSIDAASGAAKAFAAKYPDIQLNWVPTPLADTSTKLIAAIAAGSGAPDLAFVQYNDMINFTLRGGTGITDLADLMSSRRGEWVKWCLDLVTTSDGKILGLPTDIGAAATFYRRSVFDTAGLPSDPDSVTTAMTSWDDFLATATKIADGGAHHLIENATVLFDIFRQQGTQAYFDENGEPMVDSELFVQAAKFAQDFRKAGLDAAAKGGAVDSAAEMQAGTIGGYMNAAWWDILIHIWGPDSVTAGDWGVVPMPGGAAANFGGSYFVIPDMSTKKEAAWQFASYAVATEEGLSAYLKGGNGMWLPGWTPMYESEIFTTPDPAYGGQAWLQIFTAAAETVPLIRTDLNDGIAAEAVNQALITILEEGVDPQTALTEANAKIKSQL